MEIYPLKTAG